ncbi:MAG: hypothetical protein U9N38_03255, partial [Thermodesulfobacteriota bacterium]|nr:hypothetical protein [Thermodesulfobacteriota bacterium]
MKYSKKRSEKRAVYVKMRSFRSWLFIFLLFAVLVFAGYLLYLLACTESKIETGSETVCEEQGTVARSSDKIEERK